MYFFSASTYKRSLREVDGSSSKEVNSYNTSAQFDNDEKQFSQNAIQSLAVISPVAETTSKYFSFYFLFIIFKLILFFNLFLTEKQLACYCDTCENEICYTDGVCFTSLELRNNKEFYSYRYVLLESYILKEKIVYPYTYLLTCG